MLRFLSRRSTLNTTIIVRSALRPSMTSYANPEGFHRHTESNLKSRIRSVVSRIHPDLFHASDDASSSVEEVRRAKAVNENSLKVLNALFHGNTQPIQACRGQ